MKLIDVDKLTDGKGVFSHCIQVDFQIGLYILVDDLIKVIDGFSVSYDVDKIIEKLKENEQKIVTRLEEGGKNAPDEIQKTNLKLTAQLFRDYTKSQIEIVKSAFCKEAGNE